MFLDIVKSIIFGIIEGITEWLPISSTGHLILLEQFIEFKSAKIQSAYTDIFPH